MSAQALTAAEIAERVEKTRRMRVERLLPKAQELLAKHSIGIAETHDADGNERDTWGLTLEQLAAIIDDVQQDMRRQHNEDLKEAERDARDAYSQGRYEGEESARSDY